MAHEMMSAEMQRCIENCTNCHRSCTEMIPHCLSLGGPHAEVRHITLLLDCAQICQTSADFMLRGSEFHTRTCGICAEVCERCAQDCERLAGGDRMMLDCAQMCRQCAESCRQMAGHMTM